MFSIEIKLDCALYQFLIFNCLYNCFCHLDGWSLVQIPEKVNNSFLLAGQVFLMKWHQVAFILLFTTQFTVGIHRDRESSVIRPLLYLQATTAGLAGQV